MHLILKLVKIDSQLKIYDRFHHDWFPIVLSLVIIVTVIIIIHFMCDCPLFEMTINNQVTGHVSFTQTCTSSHACIQSGKLACENATQSNNTSH